MITAKQLAAWAMGIVPMNEALAGITGESRLAEAIEARDAEHRAEIERLKGELAEAKRLLSVSKRTCLCYLIERMDRLKGEMCHGCEVDAFLAAPPPAESTPVLRDQLTGEAFAPMKLKDFETTPPGDIWARLDDVDSNVRDVRAALTKTACRIDGRIDDHERRLAALDEFVRKLAQDSATQGAMATLENKVEALEDWASMRERGPFRRAKLEAKGEPGTHDEAKVAGRFAPAEPKSQWCRNCGLHISRHREQAMHAARCPVDHPKGAKP